MINVRDRQFEAYQAFLLGCKLHWTGRVFPELHALPREGGARRQRRVAAARGR